MRNTCQCIDPWVSGCRNCDIVGMNVRFVWEWNQRKTGDDGWQKVNKSACRVNNDGREGTAATADSRAATRFLLAFLRCEDFCGCFADYAVDPDNDELDEGVLGEEEEAVDGGRQWRRFRGGAESAGKGQANSAVQIPGSNRTLPSKDPTVLSTMADAELNEEKMRQNNEVGN
mmetsp:Transcript_29641/g.86322  ORF Transcript_29641/g.86322 Transcript_29641/m.86322 type:complete len:173 (-) Transcript_29641:1137-1655(-)